MTYQEQPLPLGWENELEGYVCPVCQARASKRGHNKKNYRLYKPFPVRLGPLRDIIQKEALDKESSIHHIVIDRLEAAYSAQLDMLAAELTKYYDLVMEELSIKVGIDEVMKNLKIDQKLFMRGLNPEQTKAINAVLRRSVWNQAELGMVG